MSKIYKVLAGTHSEGSKLLHKGDTVISAKPLDKLFMGKFACVGDAPVPTPAQKTQETASGASESPLGEDVSGDFEGIPSNLRVFKKGKNHFVADVKDLSEALHDEPMTAKQVLPFIKAL